MNIWVLSGVMVFLMGLRFFRPNILAWLTAIWISCFIFLRYGIEPPAPASIVKFFMAIITGSLALYATADAGRMDEALSLLKKWTTEPRYRRLLAIGILVIPVFLGYGAYRQASLGVQPPSSGRTVHPAPPDEITFKGKRIDLITGDNPYRKLETTDKEAFASHLENGRKIYYQNCVFCHGDNMEAEGNFAHGFDPLPANFLQATTIAMLEESYLFWRIAKGGPGLPEAGTPWLSSMPAWEDRLSEEDIWDVIMFLYEFTGHRPRAKENVR